jgi:hypothetical protein
VDHLFLSSSNEIFHHPSVDGRVSDSLKKEICWLEYKLNY